MGAKYPIYDGLLNIVHWQGNKICNVGNVGKYLIFAGEQKYSTLAMECLEHLAFAAVGCWTFGSRNPAPSKLR